MPTTLKTAISRYLRANNRARTTRSEYRTTLKKWNEWGNGVPIEELGRKEVREFLDWVHERAVSDEGTNPGRTSNKARDHLRAIVGWAWEQDLIDSFPRFPRPKPQRDVAGRHYLTKAEINALYFATHKMKLPKGWKESHSVGKYWRAAIVLFFNYGLDYAEFLIMRNTTISGTLLSSVFLSWNRPCTPHYPVSILRGI